ncbi:hypothetical protein BDZ94DRAFT_414048 [Collybia nuda]|uniref:Uncharacterized protein n=1 Tax=Collybia nuda TaxID=64659 RepID=A0A9P6CGF3_9AGAR|nr:hypothetical protein BDZ94DRAFT_414048 [Collybia nuda]
MRRLASKHEADLHVARGITLKLEEQSKRQSEELQRLKVELKQVEAHHEQTRHLLEERTRELTGAQKFLTRTDSLSGADVISVVESLNAEILQAAASMAESLEFTYGSHTETQRKMAYDYVAPMIGADMMHVFTLRSTQKPSEFDPTPVQIALQICIAGCCARIADYWASSSDKLDQNLKEIYKRMCEKEKPAVSGRWRSLTRAQMRNGEDRQGMLSHVVSQVIEVLLVAGWSAQGLSATEPGFNLERLVIVVDLALRLNTAIGQDITSVDILPVTIQAGAKFNSKTMEDTYAADVERGHTQNEDVVANDVVAGTTDIGLRRISRDLEGGPRTDILLKPKVILRSAVQEEFLS